MLTKLKSDLAGINNLQLYLKIHEEEISELENLNLWTIKVLSK